MCDYEAANRFVTDINVMKGRRKFQKYKLDKNSFLFSCLED